MATLNTLDGLLDEQLEKRPVLELAIAPPRKRSPKSLRLQQRHPRRTRHPRRRPGDRFSAE